MNLCSIVVSLENIFLSMLALMHLSRLQISFFFFLRRFAVFTFLLPPFSLCHSGFLRDTSVWGPLTWDSFDPKTQDWPSWTWPRCQSGTVMVRLAIHGPKLQCVWNAEQWTFTKIWLSQLYAATQVRTMWKCGKYGFNVLLFSLSRKSWFCDCDCYGKFNQSL